MRFKTYDPTSLASDIAETAESLAQEELEMKYICQEILSKKEP